MLPKISSSSASTGNPMTWAGTSVQVRASSQDLSSTASLMIHSTMASAASGIRKRTGRINRFAARWKNAPNCSNHTEVVGRPSSSSHQM